MNSTFVIDANILMSILISGKASHKPLLNHYNFIAPEFVLVEIEKYSTTILQKTKMKDDTFWAWSLYVFSQVTILPNYLLSKESLQKSNQLLQNIDLKDTSYVALSMQLDLTLLTRDKPLFTGLKKQGYRKVILFEDFLKNV